MKKLLIGAAGFVLMVPMWALAEQVTCESKDGRLNECAMNTRGNVRLVKQLSDTRCVEGQNWGLNRNSVWVKNGCRAVFESDAAYGSSAVLPTRATCESKNDRLDQCAIDTRGPVRLIRQLSDTKCVENVNWGTSTNTVWVKNGCRAEFESSGGYSGGSYRPSGDLPKRITCESERGRLQGCVIDTRGTVRLIRQLSDTQCVQNLNWGTSTDTVWVKNGCRAEFESSGGYSGGYGPSGDLPKRITCESQDERSRECAMDTRGGVRVVRQLSNTRCVEGQSWGFYRNSVWVKNGCRAEFESVSGYSGGDSSRPSGSLPSRVRCESQDGLMRECDMNTRGNVRIVEQLSSTRCVEGQNWGRTRSSVWVKDGCRAVFELEGSGGSSSNAGAPPDSLIRACNGVQNRSGTVVSYKQLRPGDWEIILKYNDGNYTCNVDRNGRVTYFEKLRR